MVVVVGEGIGMRVPPMNEGLEGSLQSLGGAKTKDLYAFWRALATFCCARTLGRPTPTSLRPDSPLLILSHLSSFHILLPTPTPELPTPTCILTASQAGSQFSQA